MLEPGMIDSTNRKANVAGADFQVAKDETSGLTDIRRIIAFVGAAYFLFMTAWVVPVACVCTVTLFFPLILINVKWFNLIEHKLCGLVNAHWNACSVYCGAQVVEYGDDIEKLSEKRCLLLANHLGLLDHFVLMQSLNGKGSIRCKWMWVIYNIWKYTPLGVMWTSHGNYFVNGGASQRERLLADFKCHLKNSFYKYDHRWIVMYPEGSRLFLVKKSGKVFAEKNGLKPLENCVYPRTGAAQVVMETLGPKEDDATVSRCGGGGPVEYIIDATIGYPKGVVPNISDAMMGDWPIDGPTRFSVHYEMIPVKPEWANEEKLKEFLYERYILKDKILADFYKTGQFEGPARKVIPNNTEMLLIEVVWAALYYLHYSVWIKPLAIYTFNLFFNLF